MNEMKGINIPMLSEDDLDKVSGGCAAATGVCPACRYVGLLTADLRCPSCGADCRPAGRASMLKKPVRQTV